jgi:hypothetical protein
VLRDMILSVPPFQRNYSWTLDQVDEFWFDLRAALTSAQSYYFMGTVVVSRATSSTAIVIDGQQRLATTTLLIAAIRDAFADGGEESRASAIANKYLTNWSLEDNAEEPRLDLNDADREYFRSAVLRQRTADPGEHRPLLAQAFARLREHVRDEAESAGPRWAERLIQWVDFVDRRAQVILMETADEADAFMVFETLNDRGLPLAVADVIKNYFLSLARGRLEDASELWLSAVQTIEEGGSGSSLTSYIRHWWNSRRGATRERDLYFFIRAAVRSERQSMEALEDLARRAPVYAALTDTASAFWEGQTDDARSAAGVLLDLGLEQYRPLALASLSDLQTQPAAEVLKATVNWSVRSLIAGVSGGGTAERLFAEAAVRVTNHRSESVASVWEDVRQLVPRDAEFESAFTSRKIHRLRTARYLLRALAEQDSLPTWANELVPAAMVPRTDATGTWGDVLSRDDMADQAGRLGNFVLIRHEDAKSLPQAPEARFSFLVEAAERAGGLITPWSALSPSEVVARQNRMAKMAVAIWPLPDGTRAGAGL